MGITPCFVTPQYQFNEPNSMVYNVAVAYMQFYGFTLSMGTNYKFNKANPASLRLVKASFHPTNCV